MRSLLQGEELMLNKHLLPIKMSIKKPYLLIVFLLIFSVEIRADQPVTDPILINTENPDAIMPTYGNWCGANHPENIEEAEDPVNELDRACQKHDLCYLQKGYLSCECDKVFNDEVISGLNQNKFVGAERLFAYSFHEYFKSSLCAGDHKDKNAPARAANDFIKDIGNKVLHFIDNLPFINE